MREVGDEPPVLVEHLSADRHRKHGILAASAVREAAAAGAALARAELLVRPKPGEVPPPWIGDEHDIPAVAAVAAVRPTLGDELLAAEVHRTVAAAAGDNGQLCAVVKHAGTLGVKEFR